MRKVLAYIVIASLALLLVFVVVTFVISSKSKENDGISDRPLTSVSYTLSGDMEGSFLDITVSYENGKVKAVKREMEHAGAKEKVKKKNLDMSVLDSLEKIVEDNGLTSWKNLPMDEIQALDESVGSISFKYNGEYHSFSSNQVLPDNDVFRTIKDILFGAME